jgi:hypothetical protein
MAKNLAIVLTFLLSTSSVMAASKSYSHSRMIHSKGNHSTSHSSGHSSSTKHTHSGAPHAPIVLGSK